MAMLLGVSRALFKRAPPAAGPSDARCSSTRTWTLKPLTISATTPTTRSGGKDEEITLTRTAVRFPKRDAANPFLGFVDALKTFVMWHYFVYGFLLTLLLFPAAAMWAYSSRFFVLLVCGYVAQLFLWRPQYNRGLEPDYLWKNFLFNPALDGIIHHLDGTMIREQVMGEEVELVGQQALEEHERETETTGTPSASPSAPPRPSPPLRLKQEKFLFAWEPHGIMGLCRCGSGGTAFPTLFPDQVKLLESPSSSSNSLTKSIAPRWGSFGKAFYIPFVREWSLCCGCVDAGKKTLAKLDESIHLIPGGVREIALTDPDSKVTKIPILDRKGFAKLAIEKGIRIVPVFCFGEKWSYKKVLIRPKWLREWLLKNQLTSALPLGRWGCTLMPFTDRGLGWVFGRPIGVEDISNDFDGNDVGEDKNFLEKQRDALHKLYMAELQRIFGEYKGKFGYAEDEELRFVNVRDERGEEEGNGAGDGGCKMKKK
eukprot:g18773.t1